ncbi:hypothetical protein ACF1G3_38865, partial [Streptomyces rochei]|uniref:hypothetical protein n=1 Tax=Streptomyces rochei TaxID=1928 RepID=UPI0036F4BEF9
TIASCGRSWTTPETSYGDPAAQRIVQLGGKISYPGPNARLACVMHRDEFTAYAVAVDGAWQ